jgi:Carboxypeptidase regulatory-like domain/TonB dependent receptor
MITSLPPRCISGLAKEAGPLWGWSLMMFILSLGAAWAQTPTAKVTGTVRDPSGAVISGVTVTVANLETGTRAESTANESGIYSISFLNPGRYELTAESQGFKRHLRQNVLLETGQVATIDITLEIGEVAETINVTAATPLLQAETSSVGQLIENTTIINMPLASRRAASLVRLMGGVTFLQEGAGGEALPFFSMAGGRARNQMWYIDGGVAQNMAIGVPQLGLNPPVEALQEFKIEANNYAAEYGRTTGGHITMTTKSGTNQFHGALYEYLRNDALDARRFFSPGVSPRKYNVFGGTVGGPIRKDRTHFFFSYEGARRRDGVTQVLNVPTPEEVRGDFSARPGQLIDPTTRMPFPNNVIPANRLDPVGSQLAALFPAPNVPGRPSGSNNFVANTVNRTTQDAFIGRIDHQLGRHDRIYARHIYTRAPVVNGAVFPNQAADPSAGQQNNQNNLFAASWLHNFSPQLINEVRYVYGNRLFENIAAGSNGSNIVGQTGLRGVPEDGMPRVNVAGLVSLGSTEQERLQRPIRTDQFLESLSWLRGSHAIKFGFEWRLSSNLDDFNGQKYGAFTFNDVATGRGFALASLLLGYVTQANVVDSDLIKSRMDYFAAYVQDDWKVTPRLTLNMGLRWDMDTPRWEALDNRQSGFDSLAINPVSGTPGIITYSGRDGRSRYAHDFDKNNWGPRFGFAWRPWGEKTVIRGGYGVMYSGIYDATVAFVTVVGFSDSREFNSPDNGLTPAFLLRDGVPAGIREPLTPGFGAVRVGERVRLAPDFFQRAHRTPYSQMFNFGIQRDLLNNMLFEIVYQGNLGHKLGGRNISINETPPQLRGAVADQRLRPFPQYGNVTLISPTWGNSTYHSMNIKVEKRFSQGLNLLANYTWSKFLDDVQAINELGGAPGLGGLQGGGYQSFYNRQLEKAISGNDIAHRFVWSSVYELPVGKGKKWDLRTGLLNQMLGGWGFGLIAEFRTGPPFGVVEQTNRLNAFSSTQRPHLLRDPMLPADRPRGELVQRWFDTDAFAFPGDGVLGNAGRAVGRGPGFANLDMSLLKDWKWGEEKSIQFRAEFFNLFNRPNFALPNNQRGNPAFGQINSTLTDGRVIQLGLKFTY